MDFDAIVKTYTDTGLLKYTAQKYEISEAKVRKILITAGVWDSDQYIEIQQFREQGLSTDKIAKKLDISRSTVNAYLPYTKGVYNADRPSHNAIKIRRCRSHKNDALQLTESRQDDILKT